MAPEREYQLLRRLASGGMGEVFVARRTTGNFEKRVALKLLLPHLVSPELVAKFHAEARLAARMHHPNIVEIFDVGEADGRPFIAMQLVEGVSLSRVIRAMKASQVMMPLPLVRLVASGICEALSYAHELRDEARKPLRVVHRDVTPSNILVSVAGAVQLTDFGIARVHNDGVATNPGVISGKIAYLAPEQVLLDAPIDARSDVWSAAVTLAELMTLHNPFRFATFEASLNAVRTANIAPVRQYRPDVSPGINAAISKALSRTQSARFPDARAFRAALMDGPVATAPELGAWVKELCAADFATLDAEVSDSPTGTRSVVALSVPPPEVEATEKRPSRRWGWVLAASVIALTGAIGLAVHQAQPAEVVAPVPVEVTPAVKPELEAPAVVEPMVETPPPAPERAAEPEPKPDPIPEPVTALKSTPRPPPRRVPAPATVAAKQPLRVGFLSADAVPWAEVSVDGKVIDRTPFARFPLGVGTHLVEFRGPSGQQQQRRISIAENAVEAVRVDFTAP